MASKYYGKTLTINDAEIIGNGNRIRGSRNKVRGNNNVLIGDNNIVTGSDNRISGNKCTVSGNGNIIAGTQNKVSGKLNKVRGRFNNVSGAFNENEEIKDFPVDMNGDKKRQREDSNEERGVMDMSREDLINYIMCSVCFAFKKCMVNEICGHMVTCLKCSEVMENCPVCRAEMKNVRRVYF